MAEEIDDLVGVGGGCTRPYVGGLITMLLSDDADLSNVKEAVEALILNVGTIACGIMGYDIMIRTETAAGHPEVADELVRGVRIIMPA